MSYLSKNSLYESIRNTVAEAQQKVYVTVNFVMVETYWNVGKQIYEAQGENQRAEYGTGLLKFLSEKQTEEFGKGYTIANLKNMRQFYLTFPNSYALRSQLSWTHYRLLMRVEDIAARNSYLEECIKSNWTPNLYEKDIEQGLIDHLQKFLLELGRGFSFVARQKRITFDGEHYFINLVFYNYILKCFVIIDLKIGKLTHQDIGQMQMYVNYCTKPLRGSSTDFFNIYLSYHPQNFL